MTYERWKGIMKCMPFETKRLSKWIPPYIVQPKFDGVRCRAIPINGHYILLSSEENIIHSVPHINEALDKLIQQYNLSVELDGELYTHDLGFQSIVSITSRTQNLHNDYEKIQYYIFDIVNTKLQFERQLKVSELPIKNSPCLKLSPYFICSNFDEIMNTYNSVIYEGYEGIVVRDAFAPYERKRSTRVMKFKPKKVDDYEIVGVQKLTHTIFPDIAFPIEDNYKDEDKEPKDLLGALICKSGDGNVFNVGTGFTREERERLWEIKEKLPGMIARVEYQHLTVGKEVPRFPVFVSIVSPIKEEEKE